jgi:hypothetical protein
MAATGAARSFASRAARTRERPPLFLRKYGAKIVPAMLKKFNGEDLPEKFYTDHVFLTRENVDKYYPDDAKPK